MKNYTCKCTENSNGTVVSTTIVTAKNANDASSKCIILETATTACFIIQ